MDNTFILLNTKKKILFTTKEYTSLRSSLRL